MKPELKMEIGQPKDENDDLIMISDDGEAEISKSLIKTKTDQKQITKQNLQDALDFAFNDLGTVDYNSDTRRYNIDDLETVDYNNDNSITDLVPIKKFETIQEEDDDEEDGLQVIKTVDYVNISNEDDDDVKSIKKTPLHPRERLKRLCKNYLIRN